MRVLLIDADTPVYVAAYKANQFGIDLALVELDNYLKSIFNTTNTQKYAGFLKGDIPSHRRKWFEDYKANRPPAPDYLVQYKPTIVTHLVDNWKFEKVDGMEVDDAISCASRILMTKGDTPVICSIDKDMKQIPGEHYNPRTQKTTVVNEQDAALCIALQVLTGDSTDNIKGLKGVGKAKAKKAIERTHKIICEACNKETAEISSPPIFEAMREYLLQHKDIAAGLLDFAENLIKVVLKRDPTFKFILHDTSTISSNAPPLVNIENLFKA